MTFKKQLEEDFIPALERMLEKEGKHLMYLQKYENKIYLDTTYLIAASKSHIRHLNHRLGEYKTYLKQL